MPSTRTGTGTSPQKPALARARFGSRFWLVEGDRVQPLSWLHAEGVDGGLGQPQLRVAEAARRSHRPEPVASLRPLDGDEALLHLAAARIERLLREPPPAVAPHGLDVLRRRRIVRASVE